MSANQCYLLRYTCYMALKGTLAELTNAIGLRAIMPYLIYIVEEAEITLKACEISVKYVWKWPIGTSKLINHPMQNVMLALITIAGVHSFLYAMCGTTEVPA